MKVMCWNCSYLSVRLIQGKTIGFCCVLYRNIFEVIHTPYQREQVFIVIWCRSCFAPKECLMIVLVHDLYAGHCQFIRCPPTHSSYATVPKRSSLSFDTLPSYTLIFWYCAYTLVTVLRSAAIPTRSPLCINFLQKPTQHISSYKAGNFFR